MSRLRTIVGLVVAFMSLVPLGSAARAGTDTQDTIKAVVVRSWDRCGSAGFVAWEDLNANWSDFGPIPIEIDFTDRSLCRGPVTYQALADSGADVLILSDPAGGGQHLSRGEIEDIGKYASEGHTLIGTFLAFANPPYTDDRWLAPLFGLVRGFDYVLDEPARDPATYRVRVPADPLFRDIGDHYVSQGYRSQQLPPDGTWNQNEMDGAVRVAATEHNRGAITIYHAASYDAIYVSNMPEYDAGMADEQFLYNAIIYPRT